MTAPWFSSGGREELCDPPLRISRPPEKSGIHAGANAAFLTSTAGQKSGEINACGPRSPRAPQSRLPAVAVVRRVTVSGGHDARPGQRGRVARIVICGRLRGRDRGNALVTASPEVTFMSCI